MGSIPPEARTTEDFQDPLENYDPKSYDDPLEQALAEQSVDIIRHEPFVVVAPDMSVAEAVKTLGTLHIGCLLVAEKEELVGIFSDRDVLDRVALEYEEIKNCPVREVMTKNPVFVYDTDSSAAVLSVMAVSGYRHVPVLDTHKRVVGIVSPQRVTGFLQSYMVN